MAVSSLRRDEEGGGDPAGLTRPVERRRLGRRVLAAAVARPILTVALVALAVRLGLAVGSFVVFRAPLVPDQAQYVDLARTIADGHRAEEWVAGYGQSLYDSTWAFVAPMAFLMKVFGPASLLAQLIAVAGGVATAVGSAVIARWIVGNRGGLVAGLILAVLPSQVYFSSAGVRESLVWAAVVAVGAGLLLTRRATPRDLGAGAAITIVALLLLGRLRQQALVEAGWAMVIASPFIATRLRGLRVAGAALICLVVPLTTAMGPGGWYYVQAAVPWLGTTRTLRSMDAASAFTATTIVQPVPVVTVTTTTHNARSPTGPSGAAPTTTTTTAPPAPVPRPGQSILIGNRGTAYSVEESYGANVRAAPRGLVAIIFRPVPGEHVNGGLLRLTMAENLAWYAMYMLAAAGLMLTRRRALLVYPLAFSALLVGVASLTEGNVGTAFRHRGQVAWAVAILAAIGIVELNERRVARRVGASSPI